MLSRSIAFKESLSLTTGKEALSLACYLLLLSTWTFVNPSVDILPAAKTVIVLLILAAPFLLVFRHLFGTVGLAETAVGFAGGFILSGITSILARLATLPNWTPILTALLCGLALMAALRRRGERQQSLCVPQEKPVPGFSTSAMVAATILLLPLSVVLIRGALAGTGAFPAFIFYTDDATDLATIRSLLAFDNFPPNSLTFSGGIKPYHFGVLEAIAHLVRVTDIKPHIAQFYLAFPIIEAGIIGAGWMLVRRLPRGLPIVLAACLIVVALNHNHGDFGISFKPVKALWQAWKAGSFAAEPTLNFLVVHLPTVGARMLAWLIFVLMLHWNRPLSRASIGVLVGSLAPLDPLYFVSMGLLLGLWSLYRLHQDRDYRQILPAAAALLIGILLMHLSGSGDSQFHLIFAPFSCAYCSENTAELLEKLLPIILAGAGIAACFRRRLLPISVIWLIAAILLLLVGNFTALIYANQTEANFNWFRIISPVPMLFAGFVVIMIMQTWEQLNPTARMLVAALIIAATIFPILRIPAVAAQVAAAPARGEDAVHTDALAEAMAAIPLDNTLVVTNDLRYPVFDYRYRNKNTLISALFGHQCYFCNGDGEAELVGAEERMREINELSSPTWSGSITALAKERHWTHFLVHKNWPYPKDMPLRLLFQNDQYAVYAFE